MAREGVWKELNGCVFAWLLPLVADGSREEELKKTWSQGEGAGMWERWEVAHYIMKQNMKITVEKKQTNTLHKLTLCLWGEGQGKFGKELIVFKLILLRMDPETALREILRSDLREREMSVCM